MTRLCSRRYLVTAAVLAALWLAMPARASESPATVIVTTSMLEAALADAYAGETPFAVERIIPPGNCPGHFDLKPQMLASIRKADIFLYHHYQQGVIERLTGLELPTRTLIVAEKGSYLIPSNYWNTVEFLIAELRSSDEDGTERDRIDRARREQELFWREAVDRNGWKDVPVVASALQADFCRWLGFKVVGILPRSEELTPDQLRDLIEAGSQMVVGNSQSDAQSARMLARRMRLPVAVLENFPDRFREAKSPFWVLSEDNLRALEGAWNRR